MRKLGATLASVLLIAALSSTPAAAGQTKIPEWIKPAVNYLDAAGYLDKGSFKANRPMARADFKRLMRKAFGPGHYKRTAGKVTAGEVGKALVKALGRKDVAATLKSATSPDGWKPALGRYFGSEIVSRELGLRRDRPTTEDSFEASSSEPMRQGDIVYAVHRAKTAPSLYSADVLRDFQLPNYGETRRKVMQYAMSLVGTPYVWAGEWPQRTPSGYPYGAQVHGGFDCSGFVWYVLQAKTSGYKPTGRPYKGWSIPERSSYDMAAGTKDRLGYKKLRAGDIVFFAPGGKKAPAKDVYHAGIYMGRGWMIHSSGSRAGVSITTIAPGSWWHGQIAWGRRVITN
jgi:cell wall-associated NlpC family hydrolase